MMYHVTHLAPQAANSFMKDPYIQYSALGLPVSSESLYCDAWRLTVKPAGQRRLLYSFHTI